VSTWSKISLLGGSKQFGCDDLNFLYLKRGGENLERQRESKMSMDLKRELAVDERQAESVRASEFLAKSDDTEGHESAEENLDFGVYIPIVCFAPLPSASEAIREGPWVLRLEGFE